ncbi:MAG TPA: hypothetical protein VJH21_02115 [Candidatus Paceibacterota bacterium]
MAAVSQVLARIEAEILNPLIILLFGFALILFLWGGFKFIRDAGSEEGRTLGKQSFIWGIVGMVIMVSVYGILRLVTSTVGVDLPPY